MESLDVNVAIISKVALDHLYGDLMFTLGFPDAHMTLNKLGSLL